MYQLYIKLRNKIWKQNKIDFPKHNYYYGKPDNLKFNLIKFVTLQNPKKYTYLPI